ncbi:MAG: GyrI-like domain-containing protein [Candidatus Hodarchaeales archaeon]|jgi:AraC family transcriptional regulator
MSKNNAVKPEKTDIIKEKSLQLIGCVFYGDPFHSAKGWSEQNEIGLTWQRFMSLYEKHEELIRKYRVNQAVTYEIHIEPKEYKENKKFYVFVGVEVTEIDKMPLEMFSKVLPTTMYALFTFKGKNMFRGGDYIWKEWLLKSDDYHEAHPFLIQAYDEKRFHGMDSEESEIDYLVPVKPKN